MCTTTMAGNCSADTRRLPGRRADRRFACFGFATIGPLPWWNWKTRRRQPQHQFVLNPRNGSQTDVRSLPGGVSGFLRKDLTLNQACALTLNNPPCAPCAGRLELSWGGRGGKLAHHIQ